MYSMFLLVDNAAKDWRALLRSEHLLLLVVLDHCAVPNVPVLALRLVQRDVCTCQKMFKKMHVDEF